MNEYQEIMKRLTDIEIQGATLAQKLDSNHKAFRDSENESRKIIDKLNETIYGNGHPGLTTKIEGMKDVPARVKILERDKWFVAGGAGVVGWLVSLFNK